MKFKINPKIFTLFNNSSVAVIVARNINNAHYNPDIALLTSQIELKLRNEVNLEELSQHPNILPWRDTYRKFGSKPSDYKSSVEALARVVLKGTEIKKISPLVDLYNLISIKHLVPVGAEDIDKIVRDLELTFADGTEEYTSLGSQENDPPKPGEVIYKDDIGVVCRRWNWREGERTKITPETKNAIIVIESVASIPINNAASELVDLVKQYCGAEITISYLNKDSSEINI